MSAQLIDGMAIARDIRAHVETRIRAHIDLGKRPPCLAVILVGNDPASEIYVKRKEQTCGSVGITSRSYRKSSEITQVELISLIKQLNDDDDVDGILLQLPLPAHLDKVECVSSISPDKDVDGI